MRHRASSSEGSLSDSETKVAVCVATFQRPHLLRTLLQGLSRQTFSKMPEPRLQIIVVDNDSEESARAICESAQGRWPVHYVCEPRRGIVRARNCAIAHAAFADCLAFIDDDEIPSATWLDELLWARAEFQADVVSGSVFPAFSENVPVWIRNGEFFRRPVFETGSRVQMSSTNSSLVNAPIFGVLDGFDERFNLTGGEDTHFFLRVRKHGFRMIFSKEAVVHEFISGERGNVPWLLRRGFQAGNSWALCERVLHPEAWVAMQRILKEVVHISRGAFQLLGSPLTGKAQAIRSLQQMSAGVGTLAGVAGHEFMPYATAGSEPTNRKQQSETSTHL